MPWQTVFAAIFQAGNTVVINDLGVFMYNGPAGLNNLVFAVNPTAFPVNDGEGNQVPQGPGAFVFGASGGKFYALSLQFQASSTFASVELWVSSTGQTGWSGTSIMETNVATFKTAFVNILEAFGGFQLDAMGTAPSGVASASIWYGNPNVGNPTVILPSGLTGYPKITNVDGSVLSNPNLVAATPITIAWTIPANDTGVFNPNVIYEILVPFNGTFETSTLAFKPYLNGANVATSGGDTIGGAFFAANTGFAGSVKVRLQVKTTGVTGTADIFITGSLGANGIRSSGVNNNDTTLDSQATAVAFNTTVSNTLAISTLWGGAVAGQTVTGHGSEFTRSGP